MRDTARLFSLVENGGEPASVIARELVGLPRNAHIIGITGAPGAGKSTLTGALLGTLRRQGNDGSHAGQVPTVAVLAVDPSSPFSGGALLGDRVRMADYATTSGIFIRSLSSRGHLGGLSGGTPAAIDLMSALGFDIVIVETVGVGQSEVDVMHLADTVLVVLAPGMGDAVQASKAGIMEIADIMVVNKADHEGARTTMRELKMELQLAVAGNPDKPAWRIPVIPTTAYTGDGVDKLTELILAHRDHLVSSGDLADRQGRRAAARIEAIVTERVRAALVGTAGQAVLRDAADHVIAGNKDPYQAATEVAEQLL